MIKITPLGAGGCECSHFFKCNYFLELGAGVNRKRFLLDVGHDIQQSMLAAGLDDKFGDIDALVLSHFHPDHAKGLGLLYGCMCSAGKRAQVFLQPDQHQRFLNEITNMDFDPAAVFDINVSPDAAPIIHVDGDTAFRLRYIPTVGYHGFVKSNYGHSLEEFSLSDPSHVRRVLFSGDGNFCGHPTLGTHQEIKALVEDPNTVLVFHEVDIDPNSEKRLSHNSFEAICSVHTAPAIRRKMHLTHYSELIEKRRSEIEGAGFQIVRQSHAIVLAGTSVEMST